MKRITLVLGLVAVMAAMMVALAAPAMAKGSDRNGGGNLRVSDGGNHIVSSHNVGGGELEIDGGSLDFGSDGLGSFLVFDDSLDFGSDGFEVGDFEQDTETGNVEQTFTVENAGTNTNQSAGIQGVANTGTNQNFQGFLQAGNFEPEIEVEDVGDFTISPESETSSIQAVDHVAVV